MEWDSLLAELMGVLNMENEFVSIRRDRLLAGSAFVPTEQRNAFFTTLFVGSDGVANIPNLEVEDDADAPTSFPLRADQGRELRKKIDEATWEVVKTIVSNAKDDVGTIEWSEIKKLTGVANWAQFAKGRMGGLHRSLHKITGVPKDAVLLWEGEGWVEDGRGDYSTGTVGIDGPAVRTLRSVCGLSESQ